MNDDEKTYGLNIWLRQPARKIRMRPVSVSALGDLQSAMSQRGFELHGATKAGDYIVVPGSNIAYVEVLGLGTDL